ACAFVVGTSEPCAQARGEVIRSKMENRAKADRLGRRVHTVHLGNKVLRTVRRPEIALKCDGGAHACSWIPDVFWRPERAVEDAPLQNGWRIAHPCCTCRLMR